MHPEGLAKVDAGTALGRCDSDDRTLSAPELLNGIEAEIVKLYKTLLGLEIVPDESFLALGGDSLLAAQVVTYVCDRFGVELSVESVLISTVSDLVAEVSAISGAPITISGQKENAHPDWQKD
jgi:acyl carrier protein